MVAILAHYLMWKKENQSRLNGQITFHSGISCQWINQFGDLPEVRTVVHVHGSETQSDSDGYPEAWFTNDFMQTGPYYKHYERRCKTLL